MPKFTVIVSDKELKALEWGVYDVQRHIQNAITELARVFIHDLIKQHTDKNPNKISKEDKELIIEALNLETAKERTDRMEAEIK